jgi:hypothetical protein
MKLGQCKLAKPIQCDFTVRLITEYLVPMYHIEQIEELIRFAIALGI